MCLKNRKEVMMKRGMFNIVHEYYNGKVEDVSFDLH
jgi:hypothetical protein